MHEITTEITIDASADQVWATLVDVPAYGSWNPFIPAASGPLRVGEKIEIRISPPGARARTFRPTVLVVDPPRELRWLGRLVLPGLFDGEHYFRIVPLGPDRVRFVHGERFSGLFVALSRTMLDTNVRAGFEAMNRALKARVESFRA